MRPGRRSFARLAIVGACAIAGAIAACKGESPAPSAPPPPAPVDAAPPPDGITSIAGYDPSSNYHLDDDSTPPRHGGAPTVHSHRILEILLRSTPSGATVAVDGVIVGDTPTYWEGDFTGREREFTFVMPGYAMARYRFVPITNGVVHGRLIKIIADPDAGAPAIPQPVDLTGSGRTGPAPPDARPAPDAAPPPPPPVPPAPPQGSAPSVLDSSIVDAGPPPP